jgi:hypothetical protein
MVNAILRIRHVGRGADKCKRQTDDNDELKRWFHATVEKVTGPAGKLAPLRALVWGREVGT